jgi:acyl-coenzyme A synthetase/AMP-(fatty) acid ligase
MNFTSVIRSRLHSLPDQPLLEFSGRWFTRGDLRRAADELIVLLEQGGVSPLSAVGFVARNRVQHAAALFGLVGDERTVSMLHAFQSPAALAADLARLRFPAVVADREDWSPAVIDAVRDAGAIGIALELDAAGLRVVAAFERKSVRLPDVSAPVSGIEILSSGTTGVPKRIPIAWAVFERSIASASAHQHVDADEPPDLVCWPLGTIGGVLASLAALHTGKRMVLLEKFEVGAFVDAIRRHRISRVGVQPTVIRMLLDAQVPRADLASLQFVFVGSAPLDPELQASFEHTYGVPVISAYGASEFAGTVVAWTLDLKRQYGDAKRGSIGKPVPGVSVRVVDPDSGAELATDAVGVLEALVTHVSDHWIRTTDLASIDNDGFVTLHGRGDGAIIRGGFKILPETVVRCLTAHPCVLDAAVVGRKDERLGAVPVAAVELRHGVQRPTTEALQAHVRAHLPAHHVPTQIRIVDRLPRTPSLKVRLVEVARLFDSPEPTP